MLRKLFAGASGTVDQWRMISNRRFSSISSAVDSIVLRSLKEHYLEVSKMTPPPKVNPPAPFTILKGALDSNGPVLRRTYGDEEISTSVMRLANIIPGGGDEDEDGINRLFLHVYVSKPDPEDSIHFLCGLYPNALVIHSVSMRPKLRSSQFLVVPKKYSGPIFRRRRRVPATLEREEGIQKKWVLKANGVKRFKQPRACFKRLHDRRTRGFTIKIERAVPSLKLPELKPDSSLGPCARFVNR